MATTTTTTTTTEEKRIAVEKLALYLSDNLPAVNEALHAGAITKDQWGSLLASIGALWDVFEKATGTEVQLGVRRHLDRFLGRPLRHPYPDETKTKETL